MSRGTVAGLPVARPIVEELPALYREYHFIEQFTAGLDEVLAPAIATLDSLHAYVDPSLAPADFLAWLGEWVGLPLDEDWPIDRRRAAVAEAGEVCERRGTVAGLQRAIELYTAGRVRVEDAGSTVTSARPGASFDQVDHDADRTVRVTVEVEPGGHVSWAGLQALVRSAVPAHLPVEIDLRERLRPPAPTSIVPAPPVAAAPTATSETEEAT